MKIRITMTVDPDYADADHEMGVTEDGFDAICDRLGDLGSDITVAVEDTT
jgi:hypothetical protein